MTSTRAPSALGNYIDAMVKDVLPCKPKRRRSFEGLEQQLCQKIKDEFDAEMAIEEDDNEDCGMALPRQQEPLTKFLSSFEQQPQPQQQRSPRDLSLKTAMVQSLLIETEQQGSIPSQPSRFDTIFSSHSHTKNPEVPPLPQQRKPSTNNLWEWDAGDDVGEDMRRNGVVVRKAWSCPDSLSRMKLRRRSSAGSFSSLLPTITEFQKTSFDNHSLPYREDCRVKKKKGRPLQSTSKRSMRHSVSLPSSNKRPYYSSSKSNHNQVFAQQEQTNARSLPFPQLDRSYVL